MAYPTFKFETTAEEVADTFATEINGKNVLITGTSLNGIGFETARVIAKYANLVIITGYNADRLKLSEDSIKQELPSANIRRLVLDLSSIEAVRKAAAEVNAYSEPIHVLINNAAAAIPATLKLTGDKLESQFATNHVGPFLFTNLIAPKLLASGTAAYIPRVVFVSSKAHVFSTGIDFDDIENPDPEKYAMTDVYSKSKSANILTALELCKRSKGKINAYSLHPGLIFTNINQKEDVVASLQAYGAIGPDGKPNTKDHKWKTIPQGAATTVVAAFDPRLNDNPGAYLDDGTPASETVAPHSSDPAIADRLWTVTERIVGEKFTF